MKTAQLLQHCNELDHTPVYRYLLGDVKLGQSIRSPIRDGDKSPSFNIFRSATSGRVVWKDFAYGTGDVYDLVKIKYNCSFKRAVEIVAEILGVQEGEVPLPVGQGILKALSKIVRYDPPAECWYEPAGTDELKLAEAWLQMFGMTLPMISAWDWVPIRSASVAKGDKKQVFLPEKGMPMFAIHIERNIKFYRPGSRLKYIGNTNKSDVYGQKWMHPGSSHPYARPTLIVGGHKDAMVSLSCLYGNGINVVTFNSEGIVPDEEKMLELYEQSGSIFVAYDNDEAGERGADKLVKQYPYIVKLKLPHIAHVNDIADMVQQTGRKSFITTVTTLIANNILD